GDAFLRIQRLARFDGVERCGRVAGVVGERVGRQTRRQVVAHASTLRSTAVIAPAVHAATPSSERRVRPATVGSPDKMGI
ncbi:MAG: hypothetical protein QOH54_684, partial [Mycobacterium sp.]|nr:hypothetical protein [Mycobacterium sp.]